MTDTTITQGFIEMVKAYEAKPELEAQIKTLGEDNAMCYQTIDLLRQQITDLQGKVTSTETRLSEVTKERDDASFRNLELDEKLSGIEKLLGVAERLEQARKAGIDQAVQAMNEHKATVDAMTPKPLVEAAVVTEQGSTIIEPSYPGPIDPVMVEGQSESLPTTQTPSDNGSPSEIGSSSPAPTEPKINPYSGFPIHYPDGEYKGQPYYEKPSWVSWAAWVDAGGEAEPYMQQVTR